MSPLIEMAGVTRFYGADDARVCAVESVNLIIEPGEFVAIIGPSGSGKSTLMNIIGLLDRPTTGRYRFFGEDVGELSHDQLAMHRNRNVGFVFQSFHLLPRSSATDNVSLPLVYRGLRSGARRRKAAAVLETVGLGHRLDHKPQQLSGGEQQRVAIARAMVGEPAILLADEPTGALDSKTGEEILAIFKDLHQGGRTILIITHDPVVAQYAERVVSLRDGRVVGDRRNDDVRRTGQHQVGVPA